MEPPDAEIGYVSLTTVLAIFLSEKTMIRNVKEFAQGHTASKRGSWD